MPQVTAASHPVTFDDVTYDMSPLTDKDVDEIDNWLRSTYIQMARAACDGMSERDRQEMLSIAMRDARRMSFMDGNGADLIGSVKGIARVIWQGLRKKHPKLTWDEFYGKLFELKNKDEESLAADIDANMAVFQEINVGAEAKSSTPGELEGPSAEKSSTPP